LHEWAHAFVAWKLGDNTARNEGRLTLNPIPHIDPFGLILILFGPFGWAKPVPINPLHFRGNKRLGIVYVSAAGPLVNLILAFLFAIVYILMGHFEVLEGMGEKWAVAIDLTMQYCIFINCALFVFNLLPIPPLDGSKILRFLSPRRWDGFFYNLEVYGPWVLLLLIFIPGISSMIFGTPLGILITWVQVTAVKFVTLFI
jgi:Zn-dependent protease